MITREEIETVCTKQSGACANGGTLLYALTDKSENPGRVLYYNGVNFIYKKNNDPRLSEIHIEECELVKVENPNIHPKKLKFDLIKKTLYRGHPKDIEELREIIKSLNK